jgi:hypothetical protein
MQGKAYSISMALILWAVSFILTGCGGGGSNDVAPPPPEPISISIGANSSRVWVGQTLQFSAHVEGDGSHAVSWSVEGTGCSGNACGTIDTNGLFSAPATLTVADVVVRGTSVADPTKSATAALLLLAPALDRLQGQYAFLLEGYLPNGELMHLGGVFTADGSGHVSGLLDAVLHTTVVEQQAFTGDYTLSTESRGHMVIGYPGDSFNFSYVLNAGADGGCVISFDDSDIRAAGTLRKQNLSAFPSAGDYAFLFTGEKGAVGRFHLDNSGNFVGTASLLHGGDWVAYGTQANGRYESYANGSGEGDIHFGFGDARCRVYVVDASTMLWLSLDPQGSGFGLIHGEVAKQSGGPFDNTSLNGTYVMSMNGVLFQSSLTHSAVGRLALDGSGAISGVYDYNDHGTVQLNVAVTTTGGMSYYRVSSDGLVDGDLDARAYHGVLVGPNRALMLTEYAFDHYGFLAGSWERQSGGPFNNGSLGGTWAYGTHSFTSNAAPLLQCGVARFDGSGHASIIGDENSFGAPVADTLLTPDYSVSTAGRIAVESMIGYQIAPDKLVIFSADPQDSAPQLLQAEP